VPLYISNEILLQFPRKKQLMNIVYVSENSIVLSIDWEVLRKNKSDRQRDEFDDDNTKVL